MSNVHKYIRISQATDGTMEVKFEHFVSREEVELEIKKFRALAEKLGVQIRVTAIEIKGQPIPEGVEHKDFLKEGE